MAENIEEKKSNTRKKTTKNSPTKKITSSKSSSNKTAANKNISKKTTTTKKNTTKKSSTTTKKSTVKKSTTKPTNRDTVKPTTKKDIDKQKEIENKIIENIENITKIENAKFQKRKAKKNLIAVGVFVVILGLIALTISLIANRIVDREFLSDTTIAIMVMLSILIEVFGAFIIINEA